MTAFIKTQSNRFINLDRIERFYYNETNHVWSLLAEVTTVPSMKVSTCCREHATLEAAQAYMLFDVTEEEREWGLSQLLRQKGVIENF